MSDPKHHLNPTQEDRDSDTPHARKARGPDAAGENGRTVDQRQEDLIDEGVEETFPASDPVSVKRIT